VDEPLSALDPTRARQAIGRAGAGARERGVTLVATLHQVDVALAHFPRIVGLRDGALAFRPAGRRGHRDRLAAAVRQHEHELLGSPCPRRPGPRHAAAAPVVMHCR
jgi:phosphonate transport system ATP-binding protein